MGRITDNLIVNLALEVGASTTAQDGASMPARNVAAFNPPPDSVAEMKVRTIRFDGTTAGSEGGVIDVSL